MEECSFACPGQSSVSPRTNWGRWTCHSTGGDKGKHHQTDAGPKRAHRAKDSFPRGSTNHMVWVTVPL